MKLRPSNPFRSHLATLAALLAAPLAHAASGTWLGTSGDWGVAGTWSGGTIADLIDSTANFTGVNITADQTINLDAARTIGNITFTDLTTASNNLTISGANILTLDRTSGVPTIDVTQTGRTLTISSQISGADGMQKNGTGTLSLSGNNNYTGTTVINGILAISNNNALGSSAAGSNQTTIAATGASTGPQLHLSGGINSAENITLTGNTEQNQFSGAILNNSGINTLSGNITLASPAGNIRITSAGGELIFGGTITQTGTTRTLVFQAGTGAAITVNNAIANNNGGLNILGFAGAGASNGVTLKGGTANNASTNVMENGLLKLGVTNALKTTASIQIGTTGTNAGFDVGTFDLAGFNQTVGGFAGAKNTGGTIAPDSSRVVTNSVTGTSLLTVGNGNATSTFNGVILDGGVGKVVALTKIGTGTQTLVGNSDYSGVTTISAGTLAITHSNALGSTTGNTTIAATGNTNGGILSLSNNINSAENITVTGATEQNSFASAILSTSGTNTLSGNITLASPTGGVRFGANAGSLTFSGNISQTGTSQGLAFFANGGTVIINNAIANNGGVLQVYGSSSVTLKGVNGVGGIGNTVVSQSGTLKLGVSEALNTTGNLDIGVGTVITTDGGTFDLAGFDQTVNALSGIGTAATNANRRVINSVAGTKTLTLGNGGGTGIFNGVILTGTGQVALIKTGIGTQTLNATNTSTGGTTINGGTLTLGHATDTLANTGAINVNGGTLALGTNTDTVGAVTLTSGSITGSGAGTLTGTGYDVRSGSASAILAGSSVALSKTTSGIVTLSGANTYTGTTAVSGGILAINGNQSAATGSVTVASGGTLKGTGTVGGATTIETGGIHNAGAHANNTPTPLAPVGTEAFSSDLTYNSQSIFAWDLGGEKDTTTGTRGSDYDAVNVGGNLTAFVSDTDTDGAGPDTITPTPASDAIFRVIVASSFDFTTVFWNSTHTWSDIFNVTGTTSGWAVGTAVNVYNYDFANNTYTLNNPVDGSFNISGKTLTWSAVPEPTSALAGLLIGAGLLRRRRSA